MGLKKLYHTDKRVVPGVVKSILIVVFLWPYIVHAQTSPGPKNPIDPENTIPPESPAWYKKIEPQWGGHLKPRGGVSWYDDKTLLGENNGEPFYDTHMDFRLNNKLLLSNRSTFETHYEAIYIGGDTYKREYEILEQFPSLSDLLITGTDVNDDRRFLSLTAVIDENDDYIIYHRLDRLYLTLQPEWGTVNIGRQALTWGNGLLFNPMDLFNPFAPTDIEKDYKVGDDMAAIQFFVENIGEIQLLYVPRRDPGTGDVETDQSSLTGKLHAAAGTVELDFLLARHYGEDVVGLGSSGYLAGTAWRLDITWNSLKEKKDQSGYFALVANMDYSWTWRNKNMYGFLEVYFNDLGDTNYSDALLDPEMIKRLVRGEIFTLGRIYLSGNIQLELHPLLNMFLTVINNVEDPSGTFQPRVVWDMGQNFQLTTGANISYGKEGTEYGGFQILDTNYISKSPNTVYLWVTYFF